MSLIVVGTPSMGLNGTPARQRASEARAAAKAPSSSRKVKALHRSFTCRAWSSTARATSTGDSPAA